MTAHMPVLEQADLQQHETRSDRELLRLAIGGDEAAFLQLYEKLKHGVFRYAFYITSSKPAAEEVTQEVFLELLREGKRYREDRGDVGAFVFGIARNLVRRRERRERPYAPLPEAEALETLSREFVPEHETLPGRMIRGEVVEKVQAAVASLPDHYRQAVVLCDLCELSYAEAAVRLDCAIGTVRSRLNRGHALLAQKLKSLKRGTELRTTGTEGWAL
jgi:RNA polymerase sigma-70 factor (ECF subfamily)